MRRICVRCDKIAQHKFAGRFLVCGKVCAKKIWHTIPAEVCAILKQHFIAGPSKRKTPDDTESASEAKRIKLLEPFFGEESALGLDVQLLILQFMDPLDIAALMLSSKTLKKFFLKRGKIMPMRKLFRDKTKELYPLHMEVLAQWEREEKNQIQPGERALHWPKALLRLAKVKRFAVQTIKQRLGEIAQNFRTGEADSITILLAEHYFDLYSEELLFRRACAEQMEKFQPQFEWKWLAPWKNKLLDEEYYFAARRQDDELSKRQWEVTIVPTDRNANEGAGEEPFKISIYSKIHGGPANYFTLELLEEFFWAMYFAFLMGGQYLRVSESYQLWYLFEHDELERMEEVIDLEELYRRLLA